MPLRILFFHADAAVLKQRIAARQCEGKDISEADLSVFKHQRGVYAGLDADEQSYTVFIDTQVPWEAEQLLARVRQSLLLFGAVKERVLVWVKRAHG